MMGGSVLAILGMVAMMAVMCGGMVVGGRAALRRRRQRLRPATGGPGDQ